MSNVAALKGLLKRAFSLHRQRVMFCLKVAATFLILILMMRSLDSRRLYQSVTLVDWRWLIAGCTFSAIFVGLRILKWTLLTRSNGLYASSLEITRGMLLALALGLITPARVGEVIAVAPFSAADKPKAVFAYVYDRVCELCIVLMFSIPAALLFLGKAGILVSFGILAGCLTGMGLVSSTALRSKMAALPLFDRLPKIRATFDASIVAPLAYWIISVFAYFVAYAIVIFFIRGAEPINDWHAVLILPVVTLSNLISITVGGLGVREGLAAALSPMVTLTPEVSAAAFFLSFFWTRVVPGIIGLGWTALGRAETIDENDVRL